jgi:hypothetical protein
MTTPIEKILPREALAHIKPRTAETRIADAERERDRIRAELHVERVAHIKTRGERDMLARRLADVSTKLTDARVILTMALSALRGFRQYVEARKVYRRISAYFQLPPEADA